MTLPGYRYVSRDNDRHGSRRWYFRRPGQPKIRLRGEPGSNEFDRAYKAALNGETAPKAKPARAAPPPANSLRWLTIEYFGSASHFTNKLDPRTQRVRRNILEGVCRTAGDALIKDITPTMIRKGIDRRAEKPEAANAFVKSMSALFKFAIAYEYATTNPTVGVERLRSKNPNGWHTWTVEEVQRFEVRHPLGTKARLALALLLFTGARRSDVVKIGRQHVRDGWLRFRATKNDKSQPVEIEIPLLPELQAVIEATPLKGDLAFLISDRGQPWASGDSFGNWFRDRCTEAELAHCSPHGLRKAGATMAAERGATENQLNAIFGWTDPKMASRYTRKANRRTLAEGGMKHMGSGQKENVIVPLKPEVSEGGAISPENMRKNNAL